MPGQSKHPVFHIDVTVISDQEDTAFEVQSQPLENQGLVHVLNVILDFDLIRSEYGRKSDIE